MRLFLLASALLLARGIDEDFSRGMENWWVEGGERVWIEDGRLHVKADHAKVPGGGVATVWHRTAHPADFEIEMDAHVVSSSIDANNINLFFSYSDPAGRPLESTRDARRTAGYALYHNLNSPPTSGPLPQAPRPSAPRSNPSAP